MRDGLRHGIMPPWPAGHMREWRRSETGPAHSDEADATHSQMLARSPSLLCICPEFVRLRCMHEALSTRALRPGTGACMRPSARGPSGQAPVHA